MKIKKKKLKKMLQNKYWEGVNVGIEYALDHPDVVQWRRTTQEITKAGDAIRQAFRDLGETIFNKQGEGKN